VGLIELLELFSNNLLPVILAVAAGYLAARFLHVNPRGIAKVTFYIFSPCLIFVLLTESALTNGDILLMSAYTVLVIMAVGLIAWIVGRLFRLDRHTLVVVIITSMFMNAGNFGLAVVLFGFGESALAYATIFFVVDAILAYTIGVFIASMGSTSFKQSLINLLKVPTVYAVIITILFLYAGWKLPLPVERTVKIFADASIPTMLVLLGLQLYSASWSGNLLPITLSSTVRLLISPLVAIGLAFLFGISGAFFQGGIIQAAMPTAVLTTVITTEYDVRPRLATSIVFITTLLSTFTLTPLLAFLGA